MAETSEMIEPAAVRGGYDVLMREVAERERRAESSPAALADEIEAVRQKYGAHDSAWVDLVEQNLATILECLRREW